MNQRQHLPQPIWVDTPADVQAMLAHLQDQPALAVDTESNSLYVYREQVCLIQISVPGTDYLLDPLAVKDISGLGPLLADPAVLKVFHGAEYDLTVLFRDFQFTVANLFDTMWASRILGWPAHGLAALLETHFGVHLNKKYQRADWGRRPLPPAQLDYARMDTHFLLPLHDIQAQEIDAGGRWKQAKYRFAKLTKTRHEPRGFDPDGFWRISGVRDLDDVGRGVLSQVYLFRDRRARDRNRPPFKILSNHAMLALGEKKPRSIKSLYQIKGVPVWLIKRYGRKLLSAIYRGTEQPLAWEERPRNNNRSDSGTGGRPSAACQARFEALRAWRNAMAEERGVEPDIILTNQILWAVARRNPRNPADLTEDSLLAPWQADEFGSALLSTIKRTN